MLLPLVSHRTALEQDGDYARTALIWSVGAMFV